MVSNERNSRKIIDDVESLKLSNENSKRLIDKPPKKLFEDCKTPEKEDLVKNDEKPLKSLIKSCLKDWCESTTSHGNAYFNITCNFQ
jgi:hypothetical protein